MRIAFAVAGMIVLIGIGGAYAWMRGQPEPKQAAVVAPRFAEIPKTESARLFVMSVQSTGPAKPAAGAAVKLAALGGTPKAKGIASKKKPAQAEAKSTPLKPLAKAKSR
jgi:hypothetical protein